MSSAFLEQQLLPLCDDEQAVTLSRFFKTGPGQYGYGDRFLGIKVPVTRGVVKAVWSRYTLADVEDALASPWHEVRLCALLVLVQIYKHARRDDDCRRRCIDLYLAHADRINNWDLVDLSCYELLGHWLLDRDRTLLYDLARSGSLWQQRIAIVSTMQFVRHGQYADTLALSDLLLFHPHDLMHKAVGWLLREVDKHDGALLRRYLLGIAPGTDRPRCAVMPRTNLRYAIEHFPEPERQQFLGKVSRSSNN